jgi:ubiquinone biosynthesis protein Coq4
MQFQELLRRQRDVLSTLKGIITLIRDPEQTDSVYDIEDGLRHIDATRLAVEYAKSKPGVADVFAARYQAPSPDLDALRQLPPESLGYTYAHYITEAGFDPNFYRKEVVTDDISYFFIRMRQTHDIWHLVTDFDVNVEGELGLKAFELAQVRRPLSAILVAGGVIETLIKNAEAMDSLLEQIARGYRMGNRAQPLLAQKWEENWDRPLSEWRSQLDIDLNA